MSSLANTFTPEPISLPIGSLRREVVTGNILSGVSDTNVLYDNGEWIPTDATYSQNAYPELYSQLGLLNGSVVTPRQNTGISNSVFGLGLKYGNGIFLGIFDNFHATSTDGINWNTVGLSETSTLRAITYGNGLYVASGTNGSLYTSNGDNKWTSRTSGTTSEISTLIYANALYVYGGAGGVLRTSTDAITWDNRTSGTTSGINAIIYESGTYMIVTNGGGIRTSNDAITWVNRTSGTTSNLFGLTYGNGVYVAGGVGGVLRSSANSVTWTTRTSNTTSTIFALAYGNGTHVYVGWDGAVGTSANGIGPYTARTSGISEILYALTYGNGLFVSGGNWGTLATSTDGITWTIRKSGTNGQIRSLTYGNGIYYYVTSGGLISSSTDAINWFPIRSQSLTYGNGLFVMSSPSATLPNAGREIGGVLLTSTDAVTWTPRTIYTTATIESLYYGGGLYFYGDYVGNIGSSTDAITWDSVGLRPASSAGTMNDFIYANSIYVALSTTGAIRTSTDNKLWNVASSGTTSTLLSVAYGNSLYIAGGFGGNLRASSNGTTWTTRTSGTTSTIQELVYNNNLFIYGGNGGVLATSPDGTTWTPRTSQTTSSIFALTYGNGLHVYVAGANAIGTSTDAITWVARTSNAVPDGQMTSVTYGNGLYAYTYRITAGDERWGTSTDGITWSPKGSLTGNLITGLIYAQGKFVYSDEKGNIATSTDAITWQSQVSGTTSSIYALTYGNGLYVYGGYGATGTDAVLATSTDAITWTARTSFANTDDASGTRIISIKYGNGIFLYVADYLGFSTLRWGTSTDGISWTTYNVAYSTPAIPEVFTSLQYGNGLFVYGTQSSKIYTTTDGTSWTLRTEFDAEIYKDKQNVSNIENYNDQIGWIAYGNGKFVATGVAVANSFITSSDGITWTINKAGFNGTSPGVFLPTAPACESLSYQNGLFFASMKGTRSEDSNLLYYDLTSTDGITWEYPLTTDGLGLGSTEYTYGNNLYVKGMSTGGIKTSTDGKIWIPRANQISYGDGLFVSTGTNGIIATSTDAYSWTVRNSKTIRDITKLNYYEGNFYYLVDNNGLGTSTDGITWEARVSGSVQPIRSFVYGNGYYLAMSIGNELRRSNNGLSWDDMESKLVFNSNKYSMAYANGIFVVFGDMDDIVSYSSNIANIRSFVATSTSNSANPNFASKYFVEYNDEYDSFVLGGNPTSAPGTTIALIPTSNTMQLKKIPTYYYALNSFQNYAYGNNTHVVIGNTFIATSSNLNNIEYSSAYNIANDFYVPDFTGAGTVETVTYGISQAILRTFIKAKD